MVPKQRGSWRLFLNVANGFDFEGGHDERHGLDAGGNVVDVPLHKHAVSLDYARIETEIQYTFIDGWDLWLRVLYDVKDQSAGIVFVESTTPAEREAIERNARIHHREDTYAGISDLELLAAYWRPGVFNDSAALEFAVGTTIPTGATEGNPFAAGDAGEEHLHIQFGSGTFDPLLEIYYAAPLPGSLVLGGFGSARFPIYENEKTYRAPVEVTSGLSFTHQGLIPRLSLRAIYTFFFQGYGYWDGERDPNSGLFSHSVALGATADVGWHTRLAVGLRYPLLQETLSGRGDAFEQGPTLRLTLMHSIDPRR